jgi:hypothetical protein
VTAFRHKDIGGLDVAMNDALGVSGIEGVSDFNGDAEEPIELGGPAGDEAGRRPHGTGADPLEPTSGRQIRRLEARLEQEGDRGLMHRLRGRTSNRKISEDLQQRALRQLRRPCYAAFGPTPAADHLGCNGAVLSR